MHHLIPMEVHGKGSFHLLGLEVPSIPMLYRLPLHMRMLLQLTLDPRISNKEWTQCAKY